MVAAHQHDYGDDARDVVGSPSLNRWLSGPRVCPVGDPPTKAHADFQELVAVSKPEDGHAGPMIDRNPWSARVFQVVDNFDSAGKRHVGHGRARRTAYPTSGAYQAGLTGASDWMPRRAVCGCTAKPFSWIEGVGASLAAG